VKSQKCPYHVTFDLDLDLEYSLDAGSSEDHHVRLTIAIPRYAHSASRGKMLSTVLIKVFGRVGRGQKTN